MGTKHSIRHTYFSDRVVSAASSSLKKIKCGIILQEHNSNVMTSQNSVSEKIATQFESFLSHI